MAFLRLCSVGLVIVAGLTLAACSGVRCKTDRPPVYSAAEKSDQEPAQDVHE